MTECCRCERTQEDGATLLRVLDQDTLCVVCVDFIQEADSLGRPASQVGLEEYD